ncbi:MAG: fibronectin type III domain-containing protein [Crocinitomicaceae bacterium]|nr:fibronectin type III domain-containing protein [Crocinitomicaceae bacterium]MCF8445324.1 fibronectin type III domain-containing protein [Crocinitomicaceae bacterium]
MRIRHLLLILGFSPVLLLGQSVTIGTSTNATNGYFYGPYYRSSALSGINYSKYAYLYTADELVTIPVGSTITMIEWQKSVGTIAASNNFQIYLENNTATTLTAGTTWGSLTSTATNVYSNANQGFTVVGPGWEGFTLATGFVYTGGSLEILTDFFRQGTASGANNFFFTPTPGKAIGWASNLVGSLATPLATTSYGNNRPNIRITFTPPPTCTGIPDGGISTSAISSICPSIDFVAQLTNASQGDGITYQWQASSDGISYAAIPGATNPSLTANQISDTYYQCVVTCGPSGQSGTSTPLQITTTPFANCYCSSSATTTFNEEILNVSIGSLNNTSTCSSTGGAGSVQSQYSNYTTSVSAPSLAATATYNLSVSVGTCGTNNNNMMKVFIDYNQNGLFTDAGETIYATATPSVGANVQNASIVIPSTALPGQTRMRVVTVQTTSANNVTPCGTYSWGETEDYTVSIAPAPTCPQPTNITLVDANNTTALLQWSNGGSETQWQIEYGVQGFTQGTGTTVIVNSNPGAINGLTPNTFYQAYVRAICSPGDSSFWTGLVSFNTYNQGTFIDWDNSCPTTGFIDISSTGSILTLNDNDEAPITFQFPVFFQATPYANATIGNNGALVFGTTTAQIDLNNTSTTIAATGLYPFWDDLASTGAGIWTQTIGVAPNRKQIVMWEKDRVGAAGNTIKFELIIEELSQEIYFLYDDVLTGSLAYDNGASATIGLAGNNQDIEISLNSTTYLSANSCVHFVYTDCPKPTNLVATSILSDGASFSWSTGLGNETAWTVIYGPQGFDPATSGTTLPATTQTITLSGLTQLTQYDIYVYANCGVGLASVGLYGTFFTPPYCANPTSMINTTAPDAILATWAWTASSANYPATAFNVQYGPTGFDLYTGTTATFDNDLTDIVSNPNLMAGGVYQLYVQAVCGNDTSVYVGPFSVIMPLTNDSICGAELIPVNGTAYTFNNLGATVTPSETALAPPATGANTTTGWFNSNLNLTTWFKFVAPNSGNVRINCTGIAFNGQIAVYNSLNCSTAQLSDLIGANDNEIGGTSLAPNFTLCGLTPNQTYYMLHDAFSFTGGNYSLSISEIDLNAGVTGNQMNICFGDTANLFNGISNYDAGGIWTQQIPTLGLQDSLFITTGLASIVFNFTYTLLDGCATDNVSASVKVFSPSSAGNDGVLTVCKKEPFLLLAALSGNVDVGGTWYDPQNQPLASNLDTAGNFPGQFNYDYIVGNGICPDDTANVLIVVDPTCTYVGVDEQLFSEIEIYPNPTSGLFQISNPGNVTLEIEITDIQSKSILNTTLDSTTKSINLESCTPGVYFVKLYNASSQMIYRIIKN